MPQQQTSASHSSFDVHVAHIYCTYTTLTSALGVLLWSRPAVQSISGLLPSDDGVVSGHGVSVVNFFIVVIFQSAQSKRLQVRCVVTTAVIHSIMTFKHIPHLSGHASTPWDSAHVS